MTLIDSTSDQDGECGCGSFGCPLECIRVKVSETTQNGFLFQSGATALLTDCDVKDCGQHGVYAQGSNTRVGFEGGSVQRNAGGGLCSDNGASATVANVQSLGNSLAGFRSIERGSKVQLQNCESGDETPYRAEKLGKVLVFDCVPPGPHNGKRNNLLEALKGEFFR